MSRIILGNINSVNMKNYKFHNTLSSKNENKKRLYLKNIILLIILLIGHSKLSKLNIKIMTFGTLLSTIDTASTNDMEKQDGHDSIAGTEKKYFMFINHYHLQILPNGIVNGTEHETKYTILQKKAEKQGIIKFIGTATCLYLCMNSCGYLYGSIKETKNCIFYENMDANNYNIYASVRWSKNQSMLLLGLDNKGNPKVNIFKSNNYKKENEKKLSQTLTRKIELHRQEKLDERLKKNNIKCYNTGNNVSLIRKIKYNKNAGRKFCHQAANNKTIKKNNKNKLLLNLNDYKNESFDKTVVPSINNSNDSSIDEIQMTNEFNKHENKTTNLMDDFNHEEMINNHLDVNADIPMNRYRRLSFPFGNDDWNNQSSITNSSLFLIFKNLYDILANGEAILDHLHDEEDYENEEDDHENYKNGDFNISNIAVQLIPVT